MAAQRVERLPEGDDWSYEVKFDGYRTLVLKDGARVELRSRNDRDLTRTYPGIATAAAALRVTSAVIDGELVAVDPSGRPSFQALQHRRAHPRHAIAFYAFDLLYLDGKDLTSRPLDERRARLAEVVRGSALLLSTPLEGSASRVVEAVRALGLEGVVAKRRSSRYVPGERSADWLKLKLDKQQEFVAGGYRPGPNGFDALLVGYYEGRAFRFAGKVRAGFTPLVRRTITAALDRLRTDSCPFTDLPNSKSAHWGGGVTAEEMPTMRWVRPELVVQIRFVEWTAEGHLRHASFVGVRDDKPARKVRREA
jgi:bifunctional non-homologous end joining protein LigD